MGKSWLLFVCLGTLAWGQAQPAAPAAQPAPAQGSGASDSASGAECRD